MRKVNIKDVDLDSVCLHFTDKRNLDRIEEFGLVARIGANAFGPEKTPKVFFSKGKEGALEILNVWILFLEIARVQYRRYMDSIKFSTKEEAKAKFQEDAGKGLLFTEESKQKAFNMFYDIVAHGTYLVLDVKDGVEYDSEHGIDEVKERYLGKNRAFIESMYGKIADNSQNPYFMERWNMHTSPNVGVSAEKIAQLEVEGKSDMLSVVRYLREQTKDVEVPVLDEFLSYAKTREENIKN